MSPLYFQRGDWERHLAFQDLGDLIYGRKIKNKMPEINEMITVLSQRYAKPT